MELLGTCLNRKVVNYLPRQMPAYVCSPYSVFYSVFFVFKYRTGTGIRQVLCIWTFLDRYMV